MANATNVAVASTPGLVSIVIPCCGMLEYTKLCVPGVLKHSRAPFEIIFLDIGSLDGTADFLSGLQLGLAGHIRIEVVRAQTDLRLKEACKKALGLARGEFLAFLNNDCIVANGWLNQLIGLLTMSSGIGVVGPMSNTAAPPQLVETVPYRIRSSWRLSKANEGHPLVDVAAVESFAQKFREEYQGNWLEAERLGGFCMLLKRDVLERVGPALDEWTDLSLFDSDILSSKARQVNYSLAVCRDLFVHHFGTRTYAQGALASMAIESTRK